MSDDGIDGLLRAARRVADGEMASSDLFAEERVPVRLRLVLAAAILTAADRPVSKRAIVDAAPAAWSATYRNHAQILDDIKGLIPVLVAHQLVAAGGSPTSADLRRQLDNAHESIRRERQHRSRLEGELQLLRQYALELHRRLEPEFEALMLERAQKVSHLRPVLVTDDDPT